MANLDEVATYRELDRSGMLQHLYALPEQCQLAWEKALAFKLPETYKRVDKAIVLGMGGSAIGGDLLRSLVLLENTLPVWVHRGYDPPPFQDNNTLLIVSSYSGNTEETLSSFAESLATEARKLAITGGGKLRAMAEKEGIPVFPIDYQAPPRAAFAHSFIPLLGIFHNLGLLQDKSAALSEAVQVMTRLLPELVESVPLVSNPAKQLATRLSGKLAVIYGAQLFSEVARRWKGQFNENGKTWAFHEVFPELNHNAIVGYEFPSNIKDRILVILLHSPSLHRRILDRYRLTSEILTLAGISHEWVEAKGNTPLAQMMSLVLFGDYVSFYLALLNGVDPTPVRPIDYLKKRLADL